MIFGQWDIVEDSRWEEEDRGGRECCGNVWDGNVEVERHYAALFEDTDMLGTTSC